MHHLHRLYRNRWTFIVLSVLTPAWIALARLPFNAIGWITLIMVFIAPVMILLLLLATFIYFFRADVRRTHKLPKPDAAWFWMLHGALFLFGLFLVDGGDVSESITSAFTELTGRGLVEVSSVLALIFAIASLAVYVWVVVYGLYVLFYRKQHHLAE